MHTLSAITCTGMRQQAFSLLEKWMARQTYKGPLEWIIVDDGTPPTVCTMGQKYIRGPVDWYEGHNTQRGNMAAGLKAATGNFIIFPEDDEWLAPEFLQTYYNLLEYASVVGEAQAKYYHVGMPAYMELHNQDSASLTQTGIRREMLPLMDKAVNSGQFFFDIEFWKSVHKEKVEALLFYEKNLLYGMKGLPGRTGLGGGHQKHRGYILDSKYDTLKNWLGADAQVYIDIQNKIKPPTTAAPKIELPKGPAMIWSNGKLVPKASKMKTA